MVAELVRVLRPGGWLAAFDTDFRTYRVASNLSGAAELPGALVRARHPGIGGDLVGLLEANGMRIRNVVTEASYGYSLAGLPIAAEPMLARAAAEGAVDQALVDRWLDEQKARTAAGTFLARWDKVLVTARRV